MRPAQMYGLPPRSKRVFASVFRIVRTPLDRETLKPPVANCCGHARRLRGRSDVSLVTSRALALVLQEHTKSLQQNNLRGARLAVGGESR
jgi:hypothetical protein